MKSIKHRPRDPGADTHRPAIGFGRLFDDAGTEVALDACLMRLLVVDDERHVADAMALLLKTQGYEVAVAYSGVEALETAERFDPQVVFLDIGMAGMDGFETARRLRSNETTAHPRRLVAVSGYGDEAFLVASRQAGFDDRLIKPVTRQTLVALLDGLR
jgi:CheY-like chemotaxis protein